MKRNLKNEIIELRNSGKKLKEIKEILNCSCSTIAYHLYEKAKKNTSIRVNKNRNANKNELKNILRRRYEQFFRIGKSKKLSLQKEFTFLELWNKFHKHPYCYLTGTSLLEEPRLISLDHKIPVSRGGSNSLDNLGFCLRGLNQSKSDKTKEEFIDLCKSVLTHFNYQIISI